MSDAAWRAYQLLRDGKARLEVAGDVDLDPDGVPQSVGPTTVYRSGFTGAPPETHALDTGADGGPVDLGVIDEPGE
jgi:hypothetical protein